MGGMLAYRLVAEMPNIWGALWVMAAAFGGRTHDGLTPTVTHPPQGHSSVSLFAHHGDLDTVVPPGPDNDPSGLVISPDLRAPSVAPGLTGAEADLYPRPLPHLAPATLTSLPYHHPPDPHPHP